MKRKVVATACLIAVCVFSQAVAGQKNRDSIEIIPPKTYKPLVLTNSPEMQAKLEETIRQLIVSYPEGSFKPDEIAVTVIDLKDPSRPLWASVRGEVKIYPASVVKMFYMAALERQLEDGKITLTPEMSRGLRDMIVDSSNEATQYVLDVLTDTSGGAELPGPEFSKWQYKRNRVNRFFSSMGYSNININQKTFCEDAYGIERQSRNTPTEAANRNKLTTNATARLMSEIVLGQQNTPDRTRSMMDLMSREWEKPSKDPDSQAVGFSGRALIDMKLTGTKLWSKAGWTSTTRHDVAYIETPDGARFVIAVFTENHAADNKPIPTVVAKVIEWLK